MNDIRTKPSTQQYRSGWDKVFGNKNKTDNSICSFGDCGDCSGGSVCYRLPGNKAASRRKNIDRKNIVIKRVRVEPRKRGRQKRTNPNIGSRLLIRFRSSMTQTQLRLKSFSVVSNDISLLEWMPLVVYW